MTPDITRLVDELHTVEENSLYTAQAHFIMAARKGTVVRIVYVASSALAAIASGIMSLSHLPWLGIVGAVTGAVGAVSAALGADTDTHAHRVAANALTRLRHESRSLRETFSPDLSKDELTREVRRITDSYNSMIQGLPPTDAKAMQRARKLIQSHVFEPDFRTEAMHAKESQVKRDSQEGPN
jgi:hypothetical protein